MIAKLRGLIDTILIDSVILDVQGVGYQVFASRSTLTGLGGQGDTVTLWIETNVREDHIHLYGFKDKMEQDWFKLLTSVQGVGAKAGLSILSVCPADQLGYIIACADKAAITKADGIGPKIATRLLTELKDKAAKIDTTTSLTPTQQSQTASNTSEPQGGSPSGAENDALSALINLGYGRAEAFSVLVQIAKANENEHLSVEQLIPLALKELSA